MNMHVNQHRRLETKADGGDSDLVREIKGFGSNVAELKASMTADLAAVRKLAEEAKLSVASTTEHKALIDGLTASVALKQAAIDVIATETKARLDSIETMLRRTPFGGAAGGDEEKAIAEAVAFYEIKARETGQRFNPATLDRDAYQAWEKSFGTYLRASDPRVIEAKALSAGSNADGGYLLTTALSARIIQKVFESSPLRRLGTVETIGTSELEIPIDVDDVGFSWVGETEARSESTSPTVGTQKIPVHEMVAKPKATQKLLEDAAINIEQWLAGKVSDRFSRGEASAFVVGNGVNKPRGILTYSAGTGRDLIPQFNSGAAAAITPDAIWGMPFNIKSFYLANACWLMKRSTVQAVMLLKNGQGDYMWRPGVAAGAPSVLCGYNVEMADDMPAVAAGALPIAFGDFRRAYTIVDRLGITTLRDQFSAKPFVEFYTRKRVGGAVTDFDAYALLKISA